MKKTYETDLLIIGGGAAGLCAAAEAAAAGAQVLVIDSDLHPGGQLVKQTHKFFGSKEYVDVRNQISSFCWFSSSKSDDKFLL